METRAARARQQLAALAAHQTDLATFWGEASSVVRRVVPHYWVPCWYTLDPSSQLITSHFHEGLDHYPEEWLRAEYLDDDVHQILGVVRSARGLTTLHELTDGDPTGTPRWQANIQLGGDQELLLALRTKDGEAWGALGLYRETGAPMFDAEEQHFLLDVASILAEGARRSLVYGEALEPDWPDGPGLLVVAADGEIESANGTGGQMLERLGNPTAVLAVARAAAGGVPASSRVRVEGGPWLTLSASRLLGERRVAVVLEQAQPARIFDLVMAGRGLTARERQVVEQVLGGASTEQMARHLVLSPYTVQEHLKSIFEKLGVRSRRELVAQAFFTHYAPRFRDNEHRVERGLPMRGNPAAPSTSPVPAD